ncbi:MAG: protein kinase [Myxococcota bacterium]
MDIRCGNCGRQFDVDETRASKFVAAQCICGARLDLTGREPSGQRLGKYVLHRRIAIGGMGEIFYGKIAGIEGFEREVAIKKMLPHLSADRSFIDMIVKEAKLTVLLNHPNIVQVYDLAREGDEYYIAMEYVPGVNVGQMLELCYKKRISLPVEVAVFITSQVLKGLAYAHELRDIDGVPMNVLHRDITPQNILVTADAWVKITDFGIAKARNEISTTSPGVIKGKLGYIAPEQLQAREATQSVDIFCAGILLWESLATKRLFKGRDEVDTFRLISECAIPALSTIRNDVDPKLEEVISHALAPTPESRFSSAEAFYNALNQAIFPRTIDDFATIAKRFLREHPDFFTEIVPEERIGLADETTIQLSPGGSESTPPITALVNRSQASDIRAGRGQIGLVLATLSALAIGAGATAWWYASQNEPAAVSTKPPESAPPPSLSEEEVQLVVSAEREGLLSCYEKQGGPSAKEALGARLVIASTGRVAEVELTGFESWPGTPSGQCVTETLRSLELRPHSEPRFDAEVTLPDAPVREVTSPTRPPRPPKPLTPKEIASAVQKRQVQIAKCWKLFGTEQAGTPKQITMKMTIAQSGRVTEADFTPTPPPNIAACLRKQATTIRFRRQPRSGQKVSVPLTIKVI